MAEATEHSATEAERKSIEIATSVEPELLVHGDRSQLHAAVSNLVENAVTYSPEASRVAVTAELAGDDVRITVADHGIGIPGDEIDRIFERFYRVDPARARDHRRHRPRAVDRQARGREQRRQRRGVERARRGLDVHAGAAVVVARSR